MPLWTHNICRGGYWKAKHTCVFGCVGTDLGKSVRCSTGSVSINSMKQDPACINCCRCSNEIQVCKKQCVKDSSPLLPNVCLYACTPAQTVDYLKYGNWWSSYSHMHLIWESQDLENIYVSYMYDMTFPTADSCLLRWWTLRAMHVSNELFSKQHWRRPLQLMGALSSTNSAHNAGT